MVTGINPLCTPGEVATQLADAEARFVLTVPEFLPTASAAAERAAAGRFDTDGNLFLLDRAKELIKVKGFQVAPAELEAVLRSHSAVADAAVIPVPDERAGELPKAYVVPARPVTPQELIDYVAARVAPHKRIHQVVFTDAIPPRHPARRYAGS